MFKQLLVKCKLVGHSSACQHNDEYADNSSAVVFSLNLSIQHPETQDHSNVTSSSSPRLCAAGERQSLLALQYVLMKSSGAANLLPYHHALPLSVFVLLFASSSHIHTHTQPPALTYMCRKQQGGKIWQHRLLQEFDHHRLLTRHFTQK